MTNHAITYPLLPRLAVAAVFCGAIYVVYCRIMHERPPSTQAASAVPVFNQNWNVHPDYRSRHRALCNTDASPADDRAAKFDQLTAQLAAQGVEQERLLVAGCVAAAERDRLKVEVEQLNATIFTYFKDSRRC